MKLTKIVATIGPASNSDEVLLGLLQKGMNVARLNFSHGTHEDHKATFKRLRSISEKNNQPLSILLDLAGPKIRLGKIEGDFITLNKEDCLILSHNKDDKGQQNRVYVNYETLCKEVNKGNRICLADGMLEVEVTHIDDCDIHTTVIQGGKLYSRKGLNLPNTQLSTPSLTEKDKNDLKFGLQLGVDFVALSFVRHPDDITKLRTHMESLGRVVPIIAKIEKPEALEHINEIIEVSNGIMVARGDLAIETPMEQMPSLQKELITKAKKACKPVIVATQMLESMVHDNRPTRAEVTDVANAVFDGTDAVMLSEETAMGDHPVQVVEQMAKILEEAEKNVHVKLDKQRNSTNIEIEGAIANSVVSMAVSLNAKVIVTPTNSGNTATLISSKRLPIPIFAFSSKLKTLRRVALNFGVYPQLVPECEHFSEITEIASGVIEDMELVKKGEFYIVTAGHPLTKQNETNLIKAVRVQ